MRHLTSGEPSVPSRIWSERYVAARGFLTGGGNRAVRRRLLPLADDGTADPRSGGRLRGSSRRCLDPDLVTTASKRKVTHLADLRLQLELCSFHASCSTMPAPGLLSIHRYTILRGDRWVMSGIPWAHRFHLWVHRVNKEVSRRSYTDRTRNLLGVCEFAPPLRP